MIELDELDYRILKMLLHNGQTSNVTLSKEFGTSINTIRNRILRLREKGVLQVIGLTTPKSLGFQIEVILGIDVEISLRHSIAQEFAQMKNVRYVAVASGVHDLIVTAFFWNMAYFFNWMDEEVTRIHGINSVSPVFFGKSLKRSYDYLELLEELIKTDQRKEKHDDN